MLHRRNGELERRHAAQARGQCGFALRPVAGVGNDDDISSQLVPVALNEVSEAGRAGFFFTFNEQSHTDIKFVRQQSQRSQVNQDASFVICRTTTVGAVALDGKFKRFGIPVIATASGLYVVMRVQQNRGLPFRSRTASHYRWIPLAAVLVGTAQYLDVVKADFFGELSRERR